MNIPQNVSSIEVWIAPGPSVAIDGQTQFKKNKEKNLANLLLLALQENLIFFTQKGATHDTVVLNCVFSCIKSVPICGVYCGIYYT
jgi:hypothetical protein